jgi:predicted nuclease with TOPRIM domain
MTGATSAIGSEACIGTIDGTVIAAVIISVIRQDFKDIRSARTEVRQDRRELRGDYAELRKDRRQLRKDLRHGASSTEILNDRKKIRDDLAEIGKDRAELRNDQNTLRGARQELKSDLRKR